MVKPENLEQLKGHAVFLVHPHKSVGHGAQAQGTRRSRIDLNLLGFDVSKTVAKIFRIAAMSIGKGMGSFQYLRIDNSLWHSNRRSCAHSRDVRVNLKAVETLGAVLCLEEASSCPYTPHLPAAAGPQSVRTADHRCRSQKYRGTGWEHYGRVLPQALAYWPRKRVALPVRDVVLGARRSTPGSAGIGEGGSAALGLRMHRTPPRIGWVSQVTSRCVYTRTLTICQTRMV